FGGGGGCGVTTFNEALVEDAALEYLRDLGYSTEFGPIIAPDGPSPKRLSFEQIYLYEQLHAAGRKLNPNHIQLVEEAVKRLERAESQNPITENLRVWRLLVEGVPVEYRDSGGRLRTEPIRLIDFDDPSNNDWLAVNQFTIIEHKNRRPDVVVF